MAKDPATLWYWNDWMGGTMTMSRHEKGAYMDLLTAQFNSGHLTETQIRKLLGNDQGLWGTVLREKFVVDSNGSFYNQRLEDEVNKRKAFVASRGQNGSKGGRPKKAYGKPSDKPYGKPTDNLLENENEIVNELLEGGTGEDAGLFNHFVITIGTPLPTTTLTAAEQNQFTMTGNKNTDFLKNQWKVFIGERIHDPPEKRRQYRQLSDLTTYFLNWIRNKYPKQNAKSRIAQVGRDFESD
jgi:uncharacterized protein YdaU (DUF1376 family)